MHSVGEAISFDGLSSANATRNGNTGTEANELRSERSEGNQQEKESVCKRERNKDTKSTIDQRRASLTPATTIGGRNPTGEEKQLPSRGEGAGYAPALRCVALLVCNAWMDAFVLACRQIDSSCGTKGGTLAIDEAVERRTADAPGPNRSCGTANRSCYKTRGTHAQNTKGADKAHFSPRLVTWGRAQGNEPSAKWPV